VSSEVWTGILAAALAIAGLLVWWLLRRRRSAETDPNVAIDGVAVESLRDVLLPDGMGGQIYIEHLLLTNRGVVVIDVKEYAGAVFASDRMDEWTVIGHGRRFGFPNPQGMLYDRVAAVRQLLRNVPVQGHILFRTSADFSKGRPKHVLLVNELEKRYRRPGRDDVERLAEAYASHWDKLKAAAQPADAPRG